MSRLPLGTLWAQFSPLGTVVLHVTHPAVISSDFSPSFSTLVHPYPFQSFIKNDVSDVIEHFLYKCSVCGCGCVLIDVFVGLPVLILKLFCDESICVVDAVDRVFILFGFLTMDAIFNGFALCIVMDTYTYSILLGYVFSG